MEMRDQVRTAELALGDARSRVTALQREHRATRAAFSEALAAFQQFGKRSAEDVTRQHLWQEHQNRIDGVRPQQSDARPDLMSPLDQHRFFSRKAYSAPNPGDGGRRGAFPASQKGRKVHAV